MNSPDFFLKFNIFFYFEGDDCKRVSSNKDIFVERETVDNVDHNKVINFSLKL
jgi:hypothetical protein